jgi:hypothetical protein
MKLFQIIYNSKISFNPICNGIIKKLDNKNWRAKKNKIIVPVNNDLSFVKESIANSTNLLGF